MKSREGIEPTDDWDQLVLLFEWPGQREYEELRPLVLFGSGGRAGKLLQVKSLELFETVHHLPQPRLFDLEETLGNGWLKALRLEDYARRNPYGPQMLQEALFPYLDALWNSGSIRYSAL